MFPSSQCAQCTRLGTYSHGHAPPRARAAKGECAPGRALLRVRAYLGVRCHDGTALGTYTSEHGIHSFGRRAPLGARSASTRHMVLGARSEVRF